MPGEGSRGRDPGAVPGHGPVRGRCPDHGGERGDGGGPGGGGPGAGGDADDEAAVPVGGDGQARSACVLEERGGSPQGVSLGGGARGGGHDVASAVFPGGTASLVIALAGRRGMPCATDAGPRRTAAAPPSPAAAGSVSRSVPAARMPLTVR